MRVKNLEFTRPVAACLLVASCCPAARAGDSRLHIGFLAGVSVADGEPANDIPGFGVQVRYRLNDDWALGAGIGRTEYDFESPAKLLGIAQDPGVEPVDSLAESTTFSAWVERALSPSESATTWFVGAGLGLASVDVPDAIGPRADGGQFDIRTDVSTEIIATAFAGVRRTFGERWYAEFRIHANQHMADWKIEDRVSGARGAIDDYLSLGGQLAVGIRF
jgi:hypothetical protein